MAYFESAYRKIMAVEGGYVDHPADPGGETYRGISRRHFPGWPGWIILDSMTDKDRPSDTLDRFTADFYRQSFWSRIHGDAIESQEIADKLFEMAVNLDVPRAVTMLQSVMNALNKNGAYYPDLKEDGDPGQKTMAALAWFMKPGGENRIQTLIGALRTKQGAYYLELAKRNPELETFIWGWLARAAG